MISMDGYNNAEDGYMEQEEEWEREGLLDPAWEKQQKKITEPGVRNLLAITDTTQQHSANYTDVTTLSRIPELLEFVLEKNRYRSLIAVS
ncbi:hypothetical protein JTB14_037447 [Gonioctena quinquepunctata]|nr:hypothetical protein JTB14_037447 [Gonioctena quinquepunctata]